MSFIFTDCMSEILEVTIARKLLPPPKGSKATRHNFLNKRLFIYDPALPGRGVVVHDSAKNYIIVRDRSYRPRVHKKVDNFETALNFTNPFIS
jgi:hypothetical protein